MHETPYKAGMLKSLVAIILAGCSLAVLLCGCLRGNGTPGSSSFDGPEGRSPGGDAGGAEVLYIDPDSVGFDFDTGRVSISGAINETITFDLRLGARRPISHLDISITVLRSADGALELPAPALYRVLPVRVTRWPGWHLRTVDPRKRKREVYDVVIPVSAPRGGLPTSLRASSPLGAGDPHPLHLFGELHIPKGTPPETYHGQVSIRHGRGPIREVPLAVTVYPFELPNVVEPAVLADLDLRPLFRHQARIEDQSYVPTTSLSGFADPQWSETLEQVLSETVRLLQAHGVTPLFTHLHPTVKFDRNENIRIDWSDFDRVIGPFLADCGLRIDRPERHLRNPQSTFTEAYLRACAAHFADRGWLDQVYVAGPASDVTGSDGLPALRRFIETVRAADRRLRILFDLTGYPSAAHTWRQLTDSGLAKRFDIWCPPAQFCDPSGAPHGFSSGGRESGDHSYPPPLKLNATGEEAFRATPQSTWMRVDRPPYSGTLGIHANETHVRVIPWQAKRYGIGTVYAGPAVNWPDADEPPTPAQCLAFDDSVLLYPGTPFGLDHPVPSMRLKHLRSGLFDMAYLQLLKQGGLEHVAETVADALTPYALTDAYRHHFSDPRACGWVQDPQLWEVGRKIMADELLLALSGGRNETSRQAESVLRWRQFIDRTRKVSLTVEGVRVRPARQVGTYRVECSVRLENLTRVPVQGHLSFAQLPIGWSTPEDQWVVAPIAPLDSRTVALVAHATSMAWGADGAMHLPILFGTRRGHTYRVTARLCYITSQKCPRPVVIDGDLSDWAVGTGNIAAGFVPITGERLLREEQTAVGPANETRCVVTHDDTYIYFGIHCTAPKVSADAGPRRNMVRYEDMIPVDGELVEILIDPHNSGTHAPEDLYHIVIKRSGTSVFERGIGTDPMIGKRSIWSADIQYAVIDHGDGWTVELRVARNALEHEAAGPQIWGMNVTRFDDARQVYSTWSGCLQNAYDPASLGNLMLP